MKRFAAIAFAVMTSSVLCLGQQPGSPPSARPDDSASFGNHHSAKKDKAPTSRTVSGQVTDDSGQVLQGAMVTLTDKKTNEKTEFFTKKDGRYQFADLSFNQDYELQARYKDKQSVSRKISQFDAAANPVRILEIPVAKETTPNSAAKNTPPSKQ
jgi:hypothetical protein